MRNVMKIHWDITKKRLHNKITKSQYRKLIKALDRYERLNVLDKDILEFIKLKRT